MAATTVQRPQQNMPPSPTTNGHNQNNNAHGNGNVNRHSLTSSITGSFVALGARLSRTISGTGTAVDHGDGSSVKSGAAASGTYYAPEVGLSDVEKGELVSSEWAERERGEGEEDGREEVSEIGS